MQTINTVIRNYDTVYRQLVSEKMSGKRIKTAPYGKQKRMLVAQTTSSSIS
jgi:hypothetical protein